MVKHFKFTFFSLITAAILFTGCNKEDTETPIADSSVTESSAVETTSVTVSETVPESPINTTESKGYEPYQLRLYDSKGTGMLRPDDYGKDITTYYLGGELDDILYFMKDEKAAGKIRQETNALDDLAVQSYYLYSEDDKPLFDENISTYCGAYNGYLFYNVFYIDFPMAYCAVFDLRTGERLELSDMFFEGEYFIDLLNKKISEEIQKLILEVYEYEEFKYIPMKREFAGLTENEFYFNSYTIYFPVNNPYFTECTSVNVRISDFDTVLNVPYDMEELFRNDAEDALFFRMDPHNVSSSLGIHTKHLQTGNIDIHLFDGALQLTQEQEEFLNTQALNMTGEILDRLKRENNWTAYTNNEEPIIHTYTSPDGTVYEYQDIFDISIAIINNNFAEIRFCQNNVYDGSSQDYNLHFDLNTFELLDTDQIFERIFGDSKCVWDYVYVYQTDDDMLGDEITDMDGFIRGHTPDTSKMKAENINVGDQYIFYSGNIDDCLIWGNISRPTNS